MAHKILIADAVSEEGLAHLCAKKEFEVIDGSPWSRADLLDKISLFDGLVVRSATLVDGELLEKASQLKAVVRAGTGVDNIDLGVAKQKNICVMNTPGTNAQACAEMVFALLLSVFRHIPKSVQSVLQGQWMRTAFVGSELHQQTLGIIGLGHIGQRVARIANGFGMNVLVYDPFLSCERKYDFAFTPVSKEGLFAQSDILTLHATLNDKTKHMIDQISLNKMKKGVVIVNCARAELIHPEDMLKALSTGQVSKLAVDVLDQEPPLPTHPFLNHPDILITPHLGASTQQAQDNVMKEVCRCLGSFFIEQKPLNVQRGE